MVILPAIVVGILGRLILQDIGLQESFLMMFISGGLFFIAAILNKSGGGDIKLFAFLGLMEGRFIIIVLFVMSVLLLLTMIAKRKTKIWLPLAPYAFASVLIAKMMGLMFV